MSLAVEQYRRLAAECHEAQVERGLRKALVTSAMPREGKTLTVTNLGPAGATNVQLTDTLPSGVTFVSGLFGVPPLLVMGVAAGVVRMNIWLFMLMIFLGRGLQSWLILAGLATLFH